MDHVLLTIAYADVFDYPLTPRELKEWMIFGGPMPKERKAWYFRRKETVIIRETRSPFQEEKWRIAKNAASILSHIPTIRLVGVTGGLAMQNAKKDDDIDFFIITASGALWTTRLFCLVLLSGLRRKHNNLHVANTICLNMFVSEDSLAIPDHDLFAAHEILQMRPIFERHNTYKKFLTANTWVKYFLPNAWKSHYD